MSPHRTFVAPTSYAGVARGKCLFCGAALAGVRAREHVFPRWLLRRRGAERSSFCVQWTSDVSGEKFGERTQSMESLVAGRVCKACNNGWMSRLEQAVDDYLVELMDANRTLTSLSRSEGEDLARWAVKTAFAYRSADIAPTLVEARHARELAEGRMPPVHVVGRQASVDAGLGCYATQRWLVSYPVDERKAVEARVGRSHKTILLLGRLLIAVCHWPDPGWPLVISRVSHVPLWPRGTWLTYGHATDRHGVEPNSHTELIDLVVGTRVTHPATRSEFVPAFTDE
jgi:hypothetical protein